MNSEPAANPIQRHSLAIGIVAIVLLAFAVYSPILPGSFLMDDTRLTGSDNPLVNGHLTLCSLWFHTDFTLATVGWWLEHLAFGPNPAGYHVVNILLHAISSVLLWRLLARLKIPGAWLAGALYAVHPVCVNSVARIAELKNTLSMPFALLSFIAYLRYEASVLYPVEPKGRPAPSNETTLWYVVSLVAFVLALLAKTSVVMFPVVLLLCALWQRRRITVKDILHTLPFFVLSLAFGLMSVWFQKNQALPSTEYALQPISFLQRFAGAGYDFWFYIGKALLPFNLTIQYPRWNIDPSRIIACVPDLMVVAVFAGCLFFYRRWGRHVLFGLGCFAVILFPSLGFFDAQFLTMWQVSDHLQYTALAAILALAASGLTALPHRMFHCMVMALVLAASVVCFRHAQVFETQKSLMTDTIAKNPSAAGAYNDLGIVFAREENYAGALQEFELALKQDPNNLDALVDDGHALALQGKFADAEMRFQIALKVKPHASQAHQLYADLLKQEGKDTEAIYHLKMAVIFSPDTETSMELAALEHATGNSREAIAVLRRAVAITPDPRVLNNLAWLLATCPDESLRDGNEAVRDAEEACSLTSYKQAAMVGTLAAAYAEAGRFSDAIISADQAVRLATKAGNLSFANANQQLLQIYRAGKSYREPAAIQ